MKVAPAVAGVVFSAAALIGLAGMAGAAEEGTVYLWVDKNGTPHYEDRPPEGSESAKELNMRYKLTDEQAIAADSKRKSDLSDAAKLREKQQAEEKTAEQQDKEKVTGEREQGCEQARAKLQKYETAHRLYKPGPDGQRNYLTDEEIDAARADARKDVEEWCGE
jgi:hypothetical protein